MSLRARSIALTLGRAGLAVGLAAVFAACAQSGSSLPITREPAPESDAVAPTVPVAPVAPESDAVAPTVPVAPEAPSPAPAPVERSPHAQGARADTFTIDYPPLGFKVAIAVPEGGHLCIILPESAQEPTACMGLDPAAMVDAFPQGPERPFGAAYARMGDWSFIVVLSPIGAGIEAREDIDEFVGGAVKGVREATSMEPKVIASSPEKQWDLIEVKSPGVPVVKFRTDAPYPTDSPQYELASTVYYAAFGGKTAMVSFLTSPKDVEKMMPYAEATIQSLVLPPRVQPERFGKPRADLDSQGTRTAIMILGPLVALGGLLFLWLAKSKKEEDDAGKGARKKGAGGLKPISPKGAASAKSSAKADDLDDDGDERERDGDSERDGDGDTDEGDASDDGEAANDDRKASNDDGAPSKEDAPSSEDPKR